jgi:hypothetical protein
MGKAASTFERLNSIWTSKIINTTSKLQLFNSLVDPTTIYASETLKMNAELEKKVDAFQQRTQQRKLSYS